MRRNLRRPGRGSRGGARRVLAGRALVALCALLGTGHATAQHDNAWIKLCQDTPVIGADGQASSDAKHVCLSHQEALRVDTGQMVASAGIRTVEGEDKAQLIVGVPLGVALRAGAVVQVDDDPGGQLRLQYTACQPAGCSAAVDIDAAYIARLKAGRQLNVAALGPTGQWQSIGLTLTGFTRAFDGPPMSRENYEQLREALAAEIRARQAAARESPAGASTPAK